MTWALALLALVASARGAVADVKPEWLLEGVVEQFSRREVLVRVEGGKRIVVAREAFGKMELRAGQKLRYSMPYEALSSVRSPHLRKRAPLQPSRANAGSGDFVPAKD